MVEKVQQGQLVLASKSPRRRYLLQQAGLKFTVMPSRLDESEVAVEAPDRYVQLLSAAKAGEIAALNPDCWVLGADTIVVLDDKVLGKPTSEADAEKIADIRDTDAFELIEIGDVDAKKICQTVPGISAAAKD